ncbi:SAM-dependent methyltransferase [Shewanella sp. FJAT-51649]|uniref:methyltransferase n=1 Tax=Shewanella sp. FJAT-51649 TaxID=2864210 RepID=UPI001C6563F5|nr:methyltransferase [Shewanella sp. FJAT-51649]QYJ70092.1 SAM-dependent methyltransferase [Shewanella sp. FJAT-51649]
MAIKRDNHTLGNCNSDSQNTLRAHFIQLDKLLEQSRALWQVRAFEAKVLPWAAQFPRLATALWALDDAVLDTLDAEQSALVDALSPALQQDLAALGLDWDLSLLLSSFAELSLGSDIDSDIGSDSGSDIGSDNNETATSPCIDLTEMAHFSAHIKGRKWEQITAFVQHLPDAGLPVLEWCAGKGHLGRLIAKARGVDVLSLEWQAMLCEEGQAFADKWHLSQRFICADAFAIEDKADENTAHQTNPFCAQQQAVALHACGDLHVRLLQLAAAAGTQALAISPCCYHLIQANQYQGLSTLAKDSALHLTRHDLQLPLQQSVIANPKQQALRHQEIAWRLGFDALQRSCRGIDAYLPLPAIKQSQLSGEFAEFCDWAATQKAVTLAADCDFGAWLEIGKQRQRLTRRIDLAAHLFRRALELWLILDRCCFLQESGYRVTLREFCATSVTPRNALILAQKSSD